MFKSVLVPLNGSPEGEASLPWVRRLVATMRPRVYLLRVVANPRGLLSEEAMVERASEARGYLDRVAVQLGLYTDVHALVREGEPGPAIAEAAREFGVELVAMSTHGHAAPIELLGSVDEYVVRTAGVPVVLLGPETDGGGIACAAAARGNPVPLPESTTRKGFAFEP